MRQDGGGSGSGGSARPSRPLSGGQIIIARFCSLFALLTATIDLQSIVFLLRPRTALSACADDTMFII